MGLDLWQVGPRASLSILWQSKPAPNHCLASVCRLQALKWVAQWGEKNCLVLACVLVTSPCVQITPKFSSLSIYYLTQVFWGSRIWELFVWVFLTHGLLRSYNQAVGWGCSHLKAWAGLEDLLLMAHLAWETTTHGLWIPRGEDQWGCLVDWLSRHVFL